MPKAFGQLPDSWGHLAFMGEGACCGDAATKRVGFKQGRVLLAVQKEYTFRYFPFGTSNEYTLVAQVNT